MPEPLLASSVLDPARLAVLDAYHVLDTVPEEGFDDIAQLAALACGAPVALVSLVAGDRQWFKARVNFPSCETDLNRSVCQYALAEPDLLVIPDLTADPRTAVNPLVTGDPHIRFYAGAPLRSPEGQVIGSLCVIDHEPRPKGLTQPQADHLRRCARQVMTLMSLRRAVTDRDDVLARQAIELRRERRLDVLANLSARLLNAANPAQVLETVLTTEADNLGIDRSYIYEVIPGQEALRLTHGVGVSEQARAFLQRMPYGSPVCGLVAQSRQPVIFSGVQAGTDPCMQPARDDGVNAYAGYPIMSRGQLCGVIAFASSRIDAFDPETLEFFATVARFQSLAQERLDGDAALREAERRARLAQEAGQVGIFEVDVASGMIQVSAEFCRLYGVPPSEIYSVAFFEALVIREDAAVPSNDDTRRAGTATLDVEYRIRRADDRALRWIARRASFVHDADGQVVSMFGAVRDITERRAVEEALQASEALARENVQRVQLALAAGAIIGTWNWDIPSDRFTVDEAFAHSFGLDPALGREGIPLARIVATVHPEDQAGLGAAITAAILRGGAYAYQYRVRRSDGRYYWIEANGRVEHGPDGTPLSFPGVLLDIEARRAAEAALRTVEERLQLALTASGVVGLWDWMVDTDLLHGDAHFARLYGLDPARTAAGLTMEQYQEFVVAEDIAPLRAAIRDTFEREAPFLVEYRLAIPGQALRWVECKGQLSHDAAGQAVRFSGTAVDTTDRKAAEVLLAESEAHWRGLFERLTEGFIVGEVVRDATGTITDWRYLDVNAAWGELVGVDPTSVVGRTLREVIPGIEEEWVHEFAEVVRSGRGITFTRQVGTLARWYEGRAFPLDAERFGVIFLEVTERLQAGWRRDALLRLGELLRDLNTKTEIAAAAAEVVSTTLGLSRAGYGSVDAAREEIAVEQDWALPGLASIAGLHTFRTYGSYIDQLKRGEIVVIADTANDPLTADTADALLQVQTRSLVNLPIMERGQFVALFFMLAPEPRVWSDGELSFIRAVADRTRSAVARVEAEERQDLLNRELSHRLKNTLAVVQSIASQTLKGVTERDLVESYEQRIIALSRAHDVLLRDNYAAASLRTVIDTVLGLLAPMDRLRIDGDDVPLGPQAALSLSLLLHELATNAVKYGAWSNGSGTVTLAWHVAIRTDPEFVLGWQERGGPPAQEPSRRGFGSRLIRNGLLGTRQTELHYLEIGFEAEFRAPDAQVRSA